MTKVDFIPYNFISEVILVRKTVTLILNPEYTILLCIFLHKVPIFLVVNKFINNL